MKRILVTEVCTQGHKLLIQQLVTANYSVRIIATELNAGSPLLQLPLEVFVGDNNSKATIATAAKGCDYIINTRQACCENATVSGKENYAQWLDSLLQIAVKKIIHIQLFDRIKIAKENALGTTLIKGVHASFSSSIAREAVCRFLFCNKYASGNNVMVLYSSQNAFPAIDCIQAMLEHDTPSQIYLVDNLVSNCNTKKLAVSSRGKWYEILNNVSILFKAELWRNFIHVGLNYF